MRNLALFCDAGSIAFICSDWRALRHVQDAADGVLHEMKNLIVWAKTNAGMGSFYHSQHELVGAPEPPVAAQRETAQLKTQSRPQHGG